MEALRRFATGRVSEIVGPATIGFDRALRLMGFTRAVPSIAAMLPPATRAWAEGFLAGVNHVIAAAPALPHEFALFDCVPAPWTLADLLAVARLAATDVSWMVFRRLLAAEAKLTAAEWQALWPRLQAADTMAVADDGTEAALGVVRGSNCAAVAGRRPGQRAGIIASDPHLSIAVPPLWLIAGLHAPGLDAVGLMIPALPVLAIGRNRWIAWGGTNLHAASSELVDVSGEPIAERREAIGVRGRGEVAVTLPETRFGPVVSDGLLLPSRRKLALRWVGHRPSDEMSAMLGVMHARDLAGFRAALAGLALPGMTMVAVEAGEGGRAGRVIAAHLPRRPPAPQPALVCPPGEAWSLDDLVEAASFGAVEEDVAVSANDRPRPTPVPVGFFFSRPDRARRMRALLERTGPVTVATMRALQQDVHQESALALRDALLVRAPDGPVRQVLAAWDGGFDAHSAGALAFEAVLAALARAMIPRHALALLAGLWSGRALVAGRVRAASPEALRAAFGEAARVLRRRGTWGEAHRLRLRHPLAALPLVGRRYAAPELAADGGNDTLNKTGHGPVRGRHRVTYGACARHISDLADPDANLFVLLGGQDGWLGSANAADQVALWRAGEYITVPLGAAAAQAWPHRTDLAP
jgi:penicillin amidase